LVSVKLPLTSVVVVWIAAARPDEDACAMATRAPRIGEPLGLTARPEIVLPPLTAAPPPEPPPQPVKAAIATSANKLVMVLSILT
jgi:hypothetical protein